MRRRRSMVVALGLGLASASGAGPVHCTTRYDAAFDRYVTECTDGSRAVTRYDKQFQRWRTDVTKPGAASQESKDVEKHGRTR